MSEKEQEEKLTKVRFVCETTIVSLKEIQDRISKEKYFDAGVAIGCLMTSLIFLK